MRGERAVGEDVRAHEAAPLLCQVTDLVSGSRGDRVVQEAAAGRGQAVRLGGVGLEALLADVLEHADRCDGVEGTAGLAVVLDTDLDPVGQPRGCDPLAGELRLPGREGDAERPHAVVSGGVQHERAPAAADVEQRLPFTQPELVADQVELADLGAVKRAWILGGILRRLLLEVGAGVHQVRIEEVRVEPVAGVVVETDRLAVPRGGVQPARDATARTRGAAGPSGSQRLPARAPCRPRDGRAGRRRAVPAACGRDGRPLPARVSWALPIWSVGPGRG